MGKIFLPEYSLEVSTELSDPGASQLEVFHIAPTLLQLRTYGRRALFKGATITNKMGEWMADFVDYGDKKSVEPTTEKDINVTYISRPDKVIFDRGRLIAIGGERHTIALPPSGWILPDNSGRLYDKLTGLPLITTPDFEAATQSRYTYFWREELGSGLIGVNRECERMIGDAFDLSIVQRPDFTHQNIGVRHIAFR